MLARVCVSLMTQKNNVKNEIEEGMKEKDPRMSASSEEIRLQELKLQQLKEEQALKNA